MPSHVQIRIRRAMVLCRLLLGALAASGAGAAEGAPPAPTGGGAAPAAEPAPATGGAPAPTLDAVTSRRAEQAADAYLRAQAEHDRHPDPEAERALADAEVELLEAQTFLDLNQPLKAGERYLEAAKLISGIPAEQRPALGARLRKASGALTALSRRLLDDKAYDLGAPEPGGPPSGRPGPPPGSSAAAAPGPAGPAAPASPPAAR
jgi:hypothetical protein